jgi:hypothetical protein
MYVMFTYLFFCYGFPLKGMRANNRFHKESHGIIKIFTVSLKPQDPILRSHWHCGIWSRGFNDTAESTSMTPSNSQNFIENFSCWIPLCHWAHGIRSHGIRSHGIRSHGIRSHGIRSRGVIETAEPDPAVSLKPRNPNFANHYLDYLGKFKAICEMALTLESGS